MSWLVDKMYQLRITMKYKEQNIYNFLLTHKATVLKEYRVSKNYVNNFEVPFK